MTSISNFDYARSIAKKYGLSRAFTFWRAARAEPEPMQQWRAFLETQVAEERRQDMMLRVLRPYMRQHFSNETKRQLLRDHITTMAQHFVPDPRLLREEPGLVVATLVGKNDATYTITIGANTSKEGEMAFGIYDVNGHYLAKMAASVGRDEQSKPVLWIGGLQGAKPPMGRDEVVKATRDLFGLRPKGAVILAAQSFAQLLNLTALRAPGNEGHISQRGLNRIRAKRKIYADYGQFWEEIGGTKMGEEEYNIPVTPQVRDISEVKQNKRSEWKKRQTLSEQLMADTRATLEGLALRLIAA